MYIEILSQQNDPAVMKSSEKEDEDVEFPSKLEFSSNFDSDSNGVAICSHFVDSQPPVTEITKYFTLTKILQVLL